MHTMDLTGKTAIVTGATQGLGRSIAEMFSDHGANVVINFLDDDQGDNRRKAMEVAELLANRSLIAAADVRQADQVSEMFARANDEFGAVDLLVNNAGVLRDRSVRKMTIEEWNDVISTNLTGAFHCCKQAAEHLSDHGRIINIASLSAATGFFGQANYSAAKAGVIAMTKVLSKELASRNILVNAIAPGVILTDMGRSIPEPNRQEMLRQIPLGRFGEPNEIASVALFLASNMSSYLTGQTIHVNGGWWG